MVKKKLYTTPETENWEVKVEACFVATMDSSGTTETMDVDDPELDW
ncbi:MAG: hypothetical protein J5769_03580 [Bacteroidales bacterium]|nr:hypothetical protein [Bacteroidales bacterium]